MNVRRPGLSTRLLSDGPNLVGLMSYYFGIPTSFSRGSYAGNKLLNKLSNKLWIETPRA
jgi:hypothetical protein